MVFFLFAHRMAWILKLAHITNDKLCKTHHKHFFNYFFSPSFDSRYIDLSECQLVQVPDAVYHLMRNTELKTCDLSSNVIRKIPPKFAVKFSLITGMSCFEQFFHLFRLLHFLVRFFFIFIFFCLYFLIFSHEDLNLSNNQINKLPDELADLTQLLRLDISHNLFLSLPHVVFKMPKLRQLKANNNAIIGEYKFSAISPILRYNIVTR